MSWIKVCPKSSRAYLMRSDSDCYIEATHSEVTDSGAIKIIIPERWWNNGDSLGTLLIDNYASSPVKCDFPGNSTRSKTSGFNAQEFATFAKRECEKRLVWTPGSEARKYTKAFEKHFGRGRFPWCAATIHWLLNNYGIAVGLKPQVSQYTYALCEAWQEMAIARGWYSDNKYGVHPKPGDIVLFDWGQRSLNESDRDWEDHIGVFLYQDTSGNYICAEGNSRNRTGIFTRKKINVQGWIGIPPGTKKI